MQDFVQSALWTNYFQNSVVDQVETKAREDVKDVMAEGWKRHKALIPVIRIPGPKPAVTDLAGISHSVGL